MLRNLLFRTILLLIAFVAADQYCQAQVDDKRNIALVARGYRDHIVLRYFATSPAVFNAAGKFGYVIEKAIAKTGTPVTALAYLPLEGSPFQRWTEQQWESGLKSADKTDSAQLKLAGLAMALSNGETVRAGTDVLANDLQSLKETRDNAAMRFGFLLIAANRSRLAAEGLALRTTDYAVETGISYVYRVRVNDPAATADWVYIQVACGSFNPDYLRNEKAIQVTEGDAQVSFSFPESTEYFAFNVERSDDDGKKYQRITSVPSLKLKPQGYVDPIDYGFIDSGLINNKRYHYRLWVSTLFADELLLGEFTAVPRDQTAPSPPFLRSAEHIAPGKIELLWEMPPPVATDLRGFAVSRSSQENGAYERISSELLPIDARRFADTGFTPGGMNYYIVDAIDSAGNVGRSFPAYVTLIDSTPPAVPQLESALIDSLGKVIIRVQPNLEIDFMGYQVLKANAADHEFSVVTETFKDSLGSARFVIYDSTTLNTLTPHIYYKLVAFDTHFNQSAASEIIRLKRRDTIPPVSPLITGFNVSDSSVLLYFATSSSEDVVRNTVLRRNAGADRYDSVFSTNDTSLTSFEDHSVQAGMAYEYAMVAADESGQRSGLSNQLLVKTTSNRRLSAPVLEGYYDSQRKEVILSFRLNGRAPGQPAKVEVYKRFEKNLPWLPLTIIPLNDKAGAFTDKLVQGSRAFYAVRLVDGQNRISNFSNEMEIVIQP